MLQLLRKPLRVVLPADWSVIVFFVALGAAYVIADISSRLGATDAREGFETFRTLLVWSTTIAYALFRALYFNPVENRAYGGWLKVLPWRYPDPLPLGPLTLVWQDVVIVAVLTALFPSGLFSRLSVANVFIVTYSLSLTYSHWRVGINCVIFVNAMLFGAFVLAIRSSMAQFTVALMMCAVAHAGTWQMLRAFPFTNELWEWLKLVPERNDRQASQGWPVPPRRQTRWRWSVTHLQAAGLALAVGWLQACLVFHIRQVPESVRFFEATYTWVALTFVLGRFWVYFWGYAPPMSILGRIATLRLIIPGYDSAILPPLATAIVAFILPKTLTAFGLQPIIVFPLSTSIVAWLALALPPRRDDWQFTGHHRIAYRFLAGSEASLKPQGPA
jgi:hypothetical protein